MRSLNVWLELSMRSGIPLMVWGTHGIGKSSVIRQFAESKNIPLVNLVLSQMEAVDLLGMPIVTQKTTLINNQDGSTGYVTIPVTQYAQPSWWPVQPSLVFLDELNRSQRYEINAVHQLACESRLHDKFLPPGSFVVAACNPPDFEYGLTMFGDPFLSRFAHIALKVHVRSWQNWAQRINMHPVVQEFIGTNQTSIGNSKFKFQDILDRIKPNPRSWEYVARVIYAAENTGINPDHSSEVWDMVRGLVGKTAGLAIQQFYLARKFNETPLRPQDMLESIGTDKGLFGPQRIPNVVTERLRSWRKMNLLPLIITSLNNTAAFIADDFLARGGTEHFKGKKDEIQKLYGGFFEAILLTPQPVQFAWLNSLDSTWNQMALLIDPRYINAYMRKGDEP